MTLEPKFKEPDSFQTKVKSGKPFNFRIKIKDIQMAILSIKIDLRSFEEINMAIKHHSQMQAGEDVREIKHLEIPFSVGMSTQSEKPCPFTDEHFRFQDSNTINHKITRFHSNQYLFLQLKAE